MKLSKDPSRKKFIKREGYHLWECKDYKTFYMTIRKQALPLDLEKNRDPNKFTLYMSSSEIFSDIDTAEKAMKKGYKRADELFEMRLNSKPNEL
tara:strand:+ start:690 stop:971 length:282 start_codon:yes stop_codon:yes gene_type:complete